MLDESKKKGKLHRSNFLEIEAKKTIDVTPSFVTEDYTYVRKSHKTLLIFRRLLKKNNNSLELRH